MQRVRLIGRFDGKITTKWYGSHELNEMWGYCAKMTFLIPGVLSSMTIEMLPDEDYEAWEREQIERERAADAARSAWERFIATESSVQP